MVIRQAAGATSPISVGPAIAAARRYLLSIQREDGHWCGELEGDTILESEYVLLLHFLGRTGEPRVAKAAEYLRRQQLPEGGWAIYPGGPPEVSCSVKAYFALKLVGDDPDAPHMARARERRSAALGGIDACNSFTRIYLAIFGQTDWADCPAVPPELVLLPDWFPFNIYRMSSWSRAIVVPLSIIWASKPFCAVPERARSLAELVVEPPAARGPVPPRSRAGAPLARRSSSAIDRVLKAAREARRGSRCAAARSGRRRRWILARLEKSGGLGAIFPPIINTILALRCLGYPAGPPDAASASSRSCERLEIEEDETLRVQPCFSAVWDTAIAMLALRESGLPPDDPELLRARPLARRARGPGAGRLAARARRSVAPGGWFFEYENEFYPDTDDTAEVLSALAAVRFPDAARRGAAARRRSRAGATGSSGCRTATAAGARSTANATTRS